MPLRALLVLLALLAACGTDKRVGDSCFDNDDCPSGSRPGQCAVNLPMGYCTRGCLSDADCDSGSICANAAGGLACAKSCTSAADCRVGEGYSCVGRSGPGRAFCYVL
jgi:hypothetical protein